MGEIFYKSLSQRESYDGSSIEVAQEVYQLKRQLNSTMQQRTILMTLCITLLGSFTANIFFVYQQYFVPWELADRLPSKFGMFIFEFLNPLVTLAAGSSQRSLN
jgi:hypothetical protein